MLPLCRHILPAGGACPQPAVRNSHYCRHHGTLKIAIDKSQNPSNPYGVVQALPFVFPEDRAAIQQNLFLVNQALNEGRIDTRKANAMTNNLRACMTNLGKMPLVEPNSEQPVQRVILTPEGEEIAPPREALEEGENPPLHHKNCPCQKCAEEYRGQPAEQHHQNCQCGLCEDAPSTPNAELPQNDVILSEAQSAQSKDLRFSPSATAANVRTAPAQKLYNKELTRDPANKEVNLYDYLYGEHHKKYEAQYAARAKAAIEAGIEPPPYEPFAINKIELECEKRYKATMEQVEKNKQIGKEIRERLFGKDEAETKPESINNEYNPATDMKEQARIAFANQPPDLNPDLW